LVCGVVLYEILGTSIVLLVYKEII